jgi:hypothetical protein
MVVVVVVVSKFRMRRTDGKYVNNVIWLVVCSPMQQLLHRARPDCLHAPMNQS